MDQFTMDALENRWTNPYVWTLELTRVDEF